MVFQQKNVVEKPVITYRLIGTLVPRFLSMACAASLNDKILDTSLSASIYGQSGDPSNVNRIRAVDSLKPQNIWLNN